MCGAECRYPEPNVGWLVVKRNLDDIFKEKLPQEEQICDLDAWLNDVVDGTMSGSQSPISSSQLSCTRYVQIHPDVDIKLLFVFFPCC